MVYLFVCCFACATCRDRQQPQRLQLRADELRKHISICQAASGQLNNTHARTRARTKPLLHVRVFCLFVPFVVLCAIPELGRGDIPATHAVPKVGTDHVDHMADSLACNQWKRAMASHSKIKDIVTVACLLRYLCRSITRNMHGIAALAHLRMAKARNHRQAGGPSAGKVSGKGPSGICAKPECAKWEQCLPLRSYGWYLASPVCLMAEGAALSRKLVRARRCHGDSQGCVTVRAHCGLT